MRLRSIITTLCIAGPALALAVPSAWAAPEISSHPQTSSNFTVMASPTATVKVTPSVSTSITKVSPSAGSSSNSTSSTTIHVTPITIQPSTGTTGSDRQPVPSGGGDDKPSNFHLVPVKIKPSGSGEGVLKDQFPKGSVIPNGDDTEIFPLGPVRKAKKGAPHDINLLIACRTVDGQSDLRFRNIGDATIPAGSHVLWTVKPTGQRGAIILPRDVKVGASVNAHDLLRDAAADGFSCASRLL